MKKLSLLAALFAFAELNATQLSQDIKNYLACTTHDFAFKVSEQDKTDDDFSLFSFNAVKFSEQMIKTQNLSNKCSKLSQIAYTSYLSDKTLTEYMDEESFNSQLQNSSLVYWGMLNGIWLSKKQENKFLFSDTFPDNNSPDKEPK